MKHIINILAITIMLFSCGSGELEKREATMNRVDSAMSDKVLGLIDSTKNSAIRGGIYEGDVKVTIDSMQNKVMHYQLSVVDLIIIQNDLLKVQAFLSSKLKNAQAQIEAAIESRDLILDSLTKSKRMYAISNAEVHMAKEESVKLKKKLSRPTVAAVSIKCYGFKVKGQKTEKSSLDTVAVGFLKRVFSTKPIQFETDVAKDIKRIVIKFIIPANEIIEKDKYAFSIKISGILNKSVILKLTGEEMPVEPITFDIIDNVTVGEHTVTIDCNGKREYSGTLNFK